jgi:hypothetical protein
VQYLQKFQYGGSWGSTVSAQKVQYEGSLSPFQIDVLYICSMEVVMGATLV